MRFLADGPSLPDSLLLARDEGRVVFFCGAGVSRAKAGLPDFFGLAEQVAASLGASANSDAIRLLNEAREIGKRTGLSGVISADRIFGLLERDFLQRDIDAAVAAALKPINTADVSAHATLLDLATTREGTVRLVTTNFDRLFERCGRTLPIHHPPRLPDPERSQELHGIVYLHGNVRDDDSGASGDGFVLSSAQFGRAYLADAWATRFFRDVVRRFVVVFVGYAADDPPIQYLLEGLKHSAETLHGVYAFQAGSEDDAAARWSHKGVQAVAYDDANGHAALWRTLDAWAHRARAPEGWVDEIVGMARRGPAALLAHERGQVAHVVSTVDGMKRFAASEPALAAEWLCVFDPARRFAKPGTLGAYPSKGPWVDPFDWYGLDSDCRPRGIAHDDYSSQRDPPPDAWSVFSLQRGDRGALGDQHASSFRGAASSYPPLSRHGLSTWRAGSDASPSSPLRCGGRRIR